VEARERSLSKSHSRGCDWALDGAADGAWARTYRCAPKSRRRHRCPRATRERPRGRLWALRCRSRAEPAAGRCALCCLWCARHPAGSAHLSLLPAAYPALVLDREALVRYLARGTAYLFHVTPEQNAESILRSGLRPGGDVGMSTRNDFFRPREGRTYLIKFGDVPIVEVDGEPRVFAVDLRQLDPDLMDPDEDIVAEQMPEMVQLAPPHRAMDDQNRELPGQTGARAAWAEQTPGFDRSDVTERARIEYGRVAYRGVILPAALELMEIPSQPLHIFAQGLDGGFRAALPTPPPASDWRTETLRARVLVSEAVRRLCEATGHAVDVRVDDPYKVRSSADRLREVARDLYLDGRVPQGDAVRAAKGAVEIAAGLHGLAPVSDLITAQSMASALAHALNVLGKGSTDDARRTREIALEATRRAGEAR
jgi:hypothetical protein